MDYYFEELREFAPTPGLARSRDERGALGAADPSNSRGDVKRPRRVFLPVS